MTDAYFAPPRKYLNTMEYANEANFETVPPAESHQALIHLLQRCVGMCGAQSRQLVDVDVRVQQGVQLLGHSYILCVLQTLELCLASGLF